MESLSWDHLVSAAAGFGGAMLVSLLKERGRDRRAVRRDSIRVLEGYIDEIKADLARHVAEIRRLEDAATVNGLESDKLAFENRRQALEIATLTTQVTALTAENAGLRRRLEEFDDRDLDNARGGRGNNPRPRPGGR